MRDWYTYWLTIFTAFHLAVDFFIGMVVVAYWPQIHSYVVGLR